MKKLDLSELRVESFEPAAAQPVIARGAFTEQQYCTIGNPPRAGEAELFTMRTGCCCV